MVGVARIELATPAMSRQGHWHFSAENRAFSMFRCAKEAGTDGESWASLLHFYRAGRGVNVQPFLIGEGWQEIKDGDASLITMHRRHYSFEPGFKRKKPLAVGPGFKLVLMMANAGAICAWRKEKHRRDGQEGVNCAIFRREHGDVASHLLRDAMDLAWQRWPGERLFTFVNPQEVRPTMMRGRPTWGHCFYQAGWRFEGLTKTGLHILAAYSRDAA